MRRRRECYRFAVRVVEIAVVLLVGCGPRIEADPDIEPGTCEAPAANALIAIAHPATPWVPPRIAFVTRDGAVDCDVDLQCVRHEDFELAGALEPSDSGNSTPADHTRHDCTCESVGSSGFDEHCDEHPIEGTRLWIESVTDVCVTGAIQRDGDEAPTPFVATLCP